jgi:chemotaxis protein MotB
MDSEEGPITGGDDDEGGAGWIVSFADLMTLLFATFVVLYGIKPEGETVAILGVTSSIREAFVEMPERIPSEQQDGPVNDGQYVFNFWKGTEQQEPIIKKYRKSEFVTAIENKDLEVLQNYINEAGGKRVNKTVIDKHSVISVAKVDKAFKFQMLSNLMFESGSYRIRIAAMPKLERVAELIKSMKWKVHVEGHTDNRRSPGSISNWELSSYRASEIARFFIDKGGIPPRLVSVAGYGQQRPIADNDSEAGRKLNRRVEIYGSPID